jgi:replicative DNA helicase
MTANATTDRKGPQQRRIQAYLAEEHGEASNEHSEAAVLGSAMLYPEDSGPLVVQGLDGGDFGNERHRHIFRAMVDSTEANTGTDPVAVCASLGKRNLEAIGGPCEVNRVMQRGVWPRYVQGHIDVLKRLSAKRRALETLAKTSDGTATDADLAKHLEALAAPPRSGATATNLGEVAMARLDDIENRLNEGKPLTGIPCGIHLLDYKTGGFQPTDLYVIGARPGVGKTAFLMELAIRVASGFRNVLFVSLEMSQEQVSDRATSSQAGIAANAARTGNLTRDCIARLRQAAEQFKAWPLTIVDTPGLTCVDILRLVRAMPAGDGVVIVDYLQYVKADDKRQPREQQVAQISKALKAIAKDTGKPVIVAAQLKRLEGNEKKGNPKPVLSDLRESGSIEQDADLVAFLWRDDYGKEQTGIPSTTELILSKHRNGPTGVVPLTFYRDIQRFEPRFDNEGGG